jgi:drug/metabolite transporter (DMT)-like permease
MASMAWASSGILINLITAKTGIPAVNLAFWRDFSSFIVLLSSLILFRSDLLKVRKQDLPYFFWMGVISIGVFHVLWNISVVLLGAGLATVFQSNAPVFVSFLAWIIFNESLTIRKLIAVFLSMTGTVFVSGISGLGDFELSAGSVVIAIAAALAYGSFSLFGKKLTQDYNNLTILCYIFGFAALSLSPYQFLKPFSIINLSSAYLEFVFLILIATIGGFILYTMGLKRFQASSASITATSEVIFAGVFAYIILQERFNAPQVIGALLIIASVIFVSIPQEMKKDRLAR